MSPPHALLCSQPSPGVTWMSPSRAVTQAGTGGQAGGKGRSTRYWSSAPQSDSGLRPPSQDRACSATSRAARDTPASRCPISKGGPEPTMLRAFGACYFFFFCMCKNVYCDNTVYNFLGFPLS